MRDESGQVIGTFDITGSEEKVRHLACREEADNSSVTHSSSEGVAGVRVVWVAPLHWAGQARLHWSVVQDYSNYWTNLQSDPVTVINRSDRSFPPPTTTSTTSTTSTTTRTSRTEAPVRAHRVYAGCDERKTCYGLPGECEDFQDCDLISTWEVTTNHTVVELYRRTLDSENVYVALGLSSDARMGEDLVTSCVSHNGQVTASSSWNGVHHNLPMVENVGQLNLLQGSLVDGELYCRLTLDNFITGRPPLPGAETFHYQLDRESYHLLLAGGPSLPPGSITYHGPRLVQASSDRVQLSQLSHVHTKVGAQSFSGLEPTSIVFTSN